MVYCLDKLRIYIFAMGIEIFTDNQPILSLFSNAMPNTKIQRWGVLLAEYGAKMHYIKGKHSIRAYILSRLHSMTVPQVAVIDTGEQFDLESLQEDNVIDTLPWIPIGLNLQEIAQAQRSEFPELWMLANSEEDDDYEIINCAVYSLAPPHSWALTVGITQGFSCRRQDSPVTRQLPTRRSTRLRHLTTRALDATDQSLPDDSDSDIEIDPVILESQLSLIRSAQTGVISTLFIALCELRFSESI